MATVTFVCAQILITSSGLTGNVSIRTTCSVFDDLDLTNTIVLCWRYYQNNAGRLFIGSILKIHFGPQKPLNIEYKQELSFHKNAQIHIILLII